MSDPSRRYADLPERERTLPDGRVVRYRVRRILPHLETLVTSGSIPVNAHDRPDLLAVRAYNDPAGYWHLCDANGVMHPRDLSGVPGRRLAVPLPHQAHLPPAAPEDA